MFLECNNFFILLTPTTSTVFLGVCEEGRAKGDRCSNDFQTSVTLVILFTYSRWAWSGMEVTDNVMWVQHVGMFHLGWKFLTSSCFTASKSMHMRVPDWMPSYDCVALDISTHRGKHDTWVSWADVPDHCVRAQSTSMFNECSPCLESRSRWVCRLCPRVAHSRTQSEMQEVVKPRVSTMRDNGELNRKQECVISQDIISPISMCMWVNFSCSCAFCSHERANCVDRIRSSVHHGQCTVDGIEHQPYHAVDRICFFFWSMQKRFARFYALTCSNEWLVFFFFSLCRIFVYMCRPMCSLGLYLPANRTEAKAPKPLFIV